MPTLTSTGHSPGEGTSPGFLLCLMLPATFIRTAAVTSNPLNRVEGVKETRTLFFCPPFPGYQPTRQQVAQGEERWGSAPQHPRREPCGQGRPQHPSAPLAPGWPCLFSTITLILFNQTGTGPSVSAEGQKPALPGKCRRLTYAPCWLLFSLVLFKGQVLSALTCFQRAAFPTAFHCVWDFFPRMKCIVNIWQNLSKQVALRGGSKLNWWE